MDAKSPTRKLQRSSSAGLPSSPQSPLVPRAPPRSAASPQLARRPPQLVACQRSADGLVWEFILEDSGAAVTRSAEQVRALGRELQLALNMESGVALAAQLRGLLSKREVGRFLNLAGAAPAPTAETGPWFVDCRVVECRGLATSERFRVSVCLESLPTVRFVTPPREGEADPVWNCDAAFVCDAVHADRLHVTLLNKRHTITGKCAVPLAQFVGGAPRRVWFNLRDVYDAMCIEDDTPLPADALLVPEGFSSAGYVHLQLQVAHNAVPMELSPLGVPLRWLPYRVQAGDLLLFSSRKLATTGTKLATRSRWDHVALIITYKAYRKLYVLQSTTSGVEVSEAESVLKGYWGSSHAIGVRRLLRPADGRITQALSDFAERNVGKPYNFNLLSSMRSKKTLVADAPSSGGSSSGGGASAANSSAGSSGSGSANTSSSNLLANGGVGGGTGSGAAGGVASAASDKLFCSELVAAAYISVGVLPATAAAASFLPSTFSSASVLTNTGSQLLPLVKLPVPSVKSEDVVWAREELHVRQAYRLAAMGRPFEPASAVAFKLLRSVRERMTVVALFPHTPADRSELALAEGDTVLLLEKDATQWWTGQHQTTGRIGAFPANHVELQPAVRTRKHRQTSLRRKQRASPHAPDASDEVVPLPPQDATALECVHCRTHFALGEQPLLLSKSPLHERCVTSFVSQLQNRDESMCHLCTMISHLTVVKCAGCARPVCGQCSTEERGGSSATCRVCAWTPTPSLVAESRRRQSGEVLVATAAHVKRSPTELTVVRGDTVDLLERLEWGWCVARGADRSVGLLPDTVLEVPEKKWSLRNLRGRKSPGRFGERDTMRPVRLSGSAPMITTLAPTLTSSTSPTSPHSPGSPHSGDEASTSVVRPAPTRPPPPRGPAPEVPQRPDLQRRVSVFDVFEPSEKSVRSTTEFLAKLPHSDDDDEVADDHGDDAGALLDSAEDEEEESSQEAALRAVNVL